MSPYLFLEIPDETIATSFNLWLFHEASHIHHQAPSGWRVFVVKKKAQVVGLVRFHVDKQVAKAFVKSPFGTIQFDQHLPAEILFSFIQFYENALRTSGVDTIVLKNPPALYAPYQHEILVVSLLNSGYQIVNAEIGAVLDVRNSFEEKIDSWELRKVRQAEENGLTVQQLGIDNLEVVYNFILACRKERGQTLSLPYETLKQIVDLFPDRFLVYVIRHDQKMAAASISIKINQNILYNFYSAHPREYDHLSPAVLLIKSLYEYCLVHQFSILDLGTSALDGKPNFGLLDFKLRLGAQPTPKYIFQKHLQ